MKQIGFVIIVNSKYISTILNRSIQEFRSKVKSLFSFFKKKSDITSHLVGHSKLKELDINDLSKRKQMIEDMETKLTGALIKNSITENSAVAGEANDDEVVTA